MKKKTLTVIVFIIVGYFLAGGILFNHILKPSTPDFVTFFEQNRQFSSKGEGFSQAIKKVENGWVHCRVEMAAFAAGPPEHIHESFDEVFYVEKGTASILINGEKKTLNAGDSILIPKGTPHKPFNETGEVVVLNDTTNSHATMPASFAYHLSLMYPEMDKIGDINSPKNLLPLSALGNDFDSWKSDAPIPIQKAIRWLLGPTARLMGYNKN